MVGVCATEDNSLQFGTLLAQGCGVQFVPGTEAVTLMDGTLSVEPDTTEALIRRLYEGLPGLSGEPAGVGVHQAASAQGASTVQAAADFLDSAEHAALHGSVSAQSDQAYWAGVLTSSQSRGAIAAAIGSGAKAHLARTLQRRRAPAWHPERGQKSIYAALQSV